MRLAENLDWKGLRVIGERGQMEVTEENIL
jgi:hypothetical protein